MEVHWTDREFDSEAIGRRVRLVDVPPAKSTRGTVLLLHGLGDHVERYEWAFRLLGGVGYRVVAIDWPGCGKSPGVRGDLPTVDEAGRLLEEVVEQLVPDLAGIVAHSTGGFLLIPALAANGSVLRAADWIWFSSPLLAPTHGQPAWKVSAAKMVARLWPRLTLDTGVRDEKCFIDSAPEDLPDEAVHHRISLRFAADLLEWRDRIRDGVAALPADCDYLLTQGSEDEVCPPPYALRFFDALPASSKTLIFARSSRHEPFRERRRAGLLNGIRGWLRARAETTD